MSPSQPLQSVLQLGDLGNLGIAFWISTGVAVFFGLVAIVATVYFYRKGRRFKRVAYTVVTANLIQDYSAKLSGLKIEYKGKNPANLSVSKIAIWNDGTETIHQTDIAGADPLRISCSGEILDSSVISTTSPANQFEIQASQNDLLITLDYLDKTQGGIVQLVHTATSSSQIMVVGSIKGSLPILKREFGPNRRLGRINDQIFRFLSAGITLIWGLAYAFSYSLGKGPSFLPLAFIGLAILGGAGMVLMLIASRIGTVPKHFESAKTVV